MSTMCGSNTTSNRTSMDDHDDVVIIIAADSTGIKVTNRGLGGCKISGM